MSDKLTDKIQQVAIGLVIVAVLLGTGYGMFFSMVEDGPESGTINETNPAYSEQEETFYVSESGWDRNVTEVNELTQTAGDPYPVLVGGQPAGDDAEGTANAEIDDPLTASADTVTFDYNYSEMVGDTTGAYEVHVAQGYAGGPYSEADYRVDTETAPVVFSTGDAGTGPYEGTVTYNVTDLNATDTGTLDGTLTVVVVNTDTGEVYNNVTTAYGVANAAGEYVYYDATETTGSNYYEFYEGSDIVEYMDVVFTTADYTITYDYYEPSEWSGNVVTIMTAIAALMAVAVLMAVMKLVLPSKRQRRRNGRL